jgi:hypothetical protein
MNLPFCIANKCVLPEWVGQNCERKHCQWIKHVSEAELIDMHLGGA